MPVLMCACVCVCVSACVGVPVSRVLHPVSPSPCPIPMCPVSRSRAPVSCATAEAGMDLNSTAHGSALLSMIRTCPARYVSVRVLRVPVPTVELSSSWKMQHGLVPDRNGSVICG